MRYRRKGNFDRDLNRSEKRHRKPAWRGRAVVPPPPVEEIGIPVALCPFTNAASCNVAGIDTIEAPSTHLLAQKLVEAGLADMPLRITQPGHEPLGVKSFHQLAAAIDPRS